MINVGIIGCGSITKMRHLPEYLKNPNSKVVGLYDDIKDRATILAAESGAKVYESVDDLLNDPEIDAISVCTSNDTHADITIRALSKGKHVLCEKPMATTLEDCIRMGEAAKKYGKTLMLAHNQRFAPAHIKAKEILKSGKLGKVITFETNFGHRGPEYWGIDKSVNTWFFDKNRAQLGVSADLGIHKLDLITWILDDEVYSVSSICTTLDKRDSSGELISVDDNLISLLEMKKGNIGTLTVSWTYYGDEDNSTIFYCEKGIMKIYDNPQYQVDIVYKNGDRTHIEVGEIQSNEDIVQENSGVIDSFVNTLVTGGKPEVPYEEAIKSMKAIFACMESSKLEKKVIVD